MEVEAVGMVAGSAVVVFINTGEIIPKSQGEVQFLGEEEGVSVFPSPHVLRGSSVKSTRKKM
jgi:hypothetical protein